jgi:hypothetical protein
MKKLLKKFVNKKQDPTKHPDFVDRRNNNPELDAHAIARGLKRRRDDKVNDAFFVVLVTVLVFVLGFFAVGSLFI